MVRKIYTASGKVEIWVCNDKTLCTLPAVLCELEQMLTRSVALGEVMRKRQNVNKCVTVTVICCTES